MNETVTPRDETVTPLEEFCADLNRLIQEAFDEGVSIHEVVGAWTMQVQELTLIAMGVLDADAEDDEEEEV